jgi:hypothetical protein
MGIPTAIAFALMSMNELGKAPVTTKLVEESLLCMTAFLQPSMPISTSGRLGRRQRQPPGEARMSLTLALLPLEQPKLYAAVNLAERG